MLKIGINGFGRIGRLVARIISERKGLEIVAINDPALTPDYAKYMLEFDSVHGRFKGKVEEKNGELIINGKKIKFFTEKEPSLIPWKASGVDIVVESSGVFTSREQCEKHIGSGAKKVVLTAPGKDMPMFVMGVNEDTYKPDMKIVSNASCTTNCLAPLVKVVDKYFGVEEALMTTVHSITASQLTVDGASKKDWRGGRSAGGNIIPSSTGAAKAVGEVLPHLKGKITGMSFRVPTLNVSAVDLTVRIKKPATYDEIVDAVRKEIKGSMKGIMEIAEEYLVSSDFIGNPHTSILDIKAGIQLSPTFIKLIAWYDNEWAYSCKVVDLVEYVGSK